MINEDTGKLIEHQRLTKNSKYRQLYRNYYAKEIGGLSQETPGLVEGTNTMCFIDNTDLPVDRWKGVMHGRVVVYYRPENSNPYCTQLTVREDRVNYTGDFGTPTVYFTPVKILLNIIVSTLNTKFTKIDVK